MSGFWKAVTSGSGWGNVDLSGLAKAVADAWKAIKWPSIDLTGLWKAVTGAVGKLKEIPIKSLALDVGSLQSICLAPL